jgi:hypothetical protein
MNQDPLSKVKATKAVEICAHFELREEARQLLREDMATQEFLVLLLSNRQYQAAVDFVAHALPQREAVWWGCLCLKHVSGPKLAEPDEAPCKAAVQWVLDPSEENRKEAEVPGRATGPGTPAGALALAASWTGGSLAPPNAPPVPPSPFMTAKGVAGAVLLAAARAEPSKIVDTQRLYAELGIGVAQGRFIWPEIKKKNPAKPSGKS